MAGIYSRGQRAGRTCPHVHLATAARVKYPAACGAASLMPAACGRVFDCALYFQDGRE
ncbi:hypothetical protein HMPREF1548_01247 [Clostridium sp. KLE 1755]|nr:hypothetical protein HMPREF1548_01247 [Clostridium sp. KLE 1755]